MKAYSATLDEYGEEYDFLPSYIYALEQGGANILASEILAHFGLGDSLEETLIADTSEALMREILQEESELTSVTDKIAKNFSQLKSTYDLATIAGKNQFIDSLKSSCSHLSNTDLDKLADELFKREASLMKKIGKGVEFWQLIVGMVELHDLQTEAICQLRDAMKDNSDFAKALDNLLAEIQKDPVSYMLEYYCTDIALELLSKAIQQAFIEMVFSPSRLVVEAATIVTKIITKFYTGTTADEIYKTTLLSSYVSEFNSAIDSHIAQFILSKSQNKPIGQDDISEYRYLYFAYITAIRETLKSALNTAKTDIQKGNVQYAIELCDKFTYETYIAWCMASVKADIDAGIVAAPGDIAVDISDYVKEVYPSYGTIVITKDNASIMDRPCSVNTDATAKQIEKGALNAEYTATCLYRNSAGNYWYQIIAQSGATGYIYSGNCEFKEWQSDAELTNLAVPSRIDVGSRFYIGGTISTKYTTISSVSFFVYDQSGNKRTGDTVEVNDKSYVLDNSKLDALVEYNILPAGTYRNVIEVQLLNYSANACWAETVTLHTSEFVVGSNSATGNAIHAESASFISRSDGVWLWPLPSYTMSDWAGCNGNSSCYFHPGDNHGGCAAASHATWDGLGHNGFDAAASIATPVYAMADGIAHTRYQDARGNYVVIEHPVGKDSNGVSWSYYTYYQHLSEFTVADGASVSAGTTIGKAGNTGVSTGPHLHVGMVLGKSGCYDSIYELECKGWLTEPGFSEGRILSNPARNSPAGDPYYTDGCEANVKGHAGSVMYTRNLSEVSIGEPNNQPCSHTYTSVETPATCTEGGSRVFTCSSCGDTYSEPLEVLGHNYLDSKTDATCVSAPYITYTCSRCGDSYTERTDDWSEWSTEYPVGIPESLIEKKAQYSTLEKEYTTSESDVLDGWISDGTTYSDWGAEQTATSKPSESDTLRITNETQTGWGYYHWCNYYYNGGNNWNVDSVQYGSPCYQHSYTSNFELPAMSFSDKGGQQAYGGSGTGASPCAYNFYVWFRDTSADTFTYSYQTRNEVYRFYKWSDQWSDWFDEEVSESEDLQVKTQTVYRYYTGELAEHKYENGVCSVCGHNKNGVLTFELNEVGDGYLVSGCDQSATGELVIPATYHGLPVTSINHEAFKGYSKLTSIIIPDSVTQIGNMAFSGCGGLTIIDIPDGVTGIGHAAFAECANLTAIDLPEGLNFLGDTAFYGCTSLADIIIPGGVKYLGTGAFHNCTALTSVILCDGVTVLWNGLFYGCKKLSHIVIPGSVTNIYGGVFEDCSNLSTVIYCGTQKQWNAIEMDKDNESLNKATLQFHNYENGVCSICKHKTAYIIGDANGDGKANLRDAILVLQAANGKDVAIDRIASDVTGDGKVNLQDAIRILKRANGNKEPFPAEK